MGTIYAWPSVFVLLKPSLAPFALFGIRHRSWWVALGAFGLVALAFLLMWPDYVTVMRNATNPNGLLYSLTDAPLMLVPLIAWLGSTTRRSLSGRSATASGAATLPPRPMDPAPEADQDRDQGARDDDDPGEAERRRGPLDHELRRRHRDHEIGRERDRERDPDRDQPRPVAPISRNTKAGRRSARASS